MRKLFLSLGWMICFHTNILAGNFTQINLYSPTSLDPKNLNFSVRHRFYGDITDAPLKNFFGIDAGANVQLSFRYQILKNLEVKTSYTRSKKEKTIGLSYKVETEKFPVLTQLDLEYFSFKEIGLKEETRSNFMALFSLQNKPLLERVVGTLNIGYDGYYERFLLGAGITISILKDFGLFEQVSLLGEYYPVLDRDSADEFLRPYIGPGNGFAFGIKLDTYGHRFLILVTNTDDLHLRRSTLGVEENGHLRFGFNIERKL